MTKAEERAAIVVARAKVADAVAELERATRRSVVSIAVKQISVRRTGQAAPLFEREFEFELWPRLN